MKEITLTGIKCLLHVLPGEILELRSHFYEILEITNYIMEKHQRHMYNCLNGYKQRDHETKYFRCETYT